MIQTIQRLLLLLMLCCTQISFGQPVSAYGDFQNQFFAWDNGMIRKIEYLTPIDYRVGRVAIPYIDNARNFKIYSQGATTQINTGNTTAFFATDNLVTFLNNTILNVWENGEITRLSNYCRQFVTGDSLVMYFDQVQSEFRMYYDGEIHVLETFLSGNNLFQTDSPQRRYDNMDVASGQIPSFQLSDNIAAYLNFAGVFKIFYRGQLIEQETYQIKNFGVGRNTVAYVDVNNEFQIFQNGNTRIIDNFAPYQYQVGDDVVAFVGSDNYFKIYYNDSIYNIGYFEPEFVVVDNIVYYQDQTGYFNVFYKGKNYSLETYMPEGITARYNSLAYITRGRMIKLFTDGQVYDVVNADVPYWRLDYDVLQYRFGQNMNKVFYKGKTY